MADDIFDKMWEQLARIYDALRDGLVPRSSGGDRQTVGGALLQGSLRAFGLQDLEPLLTRKQPPEEPYDEPEQSQERSEAPRDWSFLNKRSRRTKQADAAAPTQSLTDEAAQAAADIQRLAKQTGILTGDLEKLSRATRHASGVPGGSPQDRPHGSARADDAQKQGDSDRTNDLLDTAVTQLGVIAATLAGMREESKVALKQLNKTQGDSLTVLKEIRDKLPGSQSKPAAPKTAGMSSGARGLFA